MARLTLVAALALFASACSAEPSYVIRLDLDQVAASTAARDTAPGFASLSR